MTFKVATVTERLAQTKQQLSVVMTGPFGIGKTSLVRGLNTDGTIIVDCEAGMLPVRDWPGRSVSIRRYLDFVDLTCLIGGVDPAATEAEPFSHAHHEYVRKLYRDLNLSGLDKYFVDSLSEVVRLSLIWAQNQPSSFSERTGKLDLRSAYGLMAKEVTRTLRHLQHAPGTVIFVCGLQRDPDNPGRWELQLEGNKVGRELPFVADEVIAFDFFDWSEGSGWRHAPGTGEHRAFCCGSPNPWSLPAKDRSGRLDLIEEPHLGKLIAKILGNNGGQNA
jgi:hypothetical protein